jgi:hypothetical protein
MAIKIEIPLVLRQGANGQESVEVIGNTIRECMADLMKQLPVFKDLFNEKNPVVWIALNKEMVSLLDLDKQITESDCLDLLFLLGGG